ncbi:MAG: transporter substrate-binding domain-containing protein [Lactobacillaceae bacterium]|jgi:cystine transport system substrate-binding protein|nr:transporter substrate-binding domain-containing protein [Lactobacillaceae bacterium]
MKKQLFIIGSIILLGISILSPVIANASTDNYLVKKNKLVIGMEGSYAPFGYRNKKGKLTGFEVEIAKLLAKKLNLKPEFKLTKFDSLTIGLNSHNFDIVLNNMGYSKERGQEFLFSKTYLYSRTVAIHTKKVKINSLKDIKNKKMAQSTASNYGQMAIKAGGKIVSVTGFAEELNLIASGRADGSINDLGAFSIWKKENKNNLLVATDLKDVKAEGVYALINKKEIKLQQKIDDTLMTLKKDGTLKKLSIKYFGMDLTEQ